MKVEIVRSSNQLSEHDIQLLEEQIGYSIPEEYRKFLLLHNSGHPRPSNFNMTNNENDPESGAVNFFLGIDVPEETLNLSYTLETFRNRVPTDFFPIALDPGGNLIGIITKRAKKGSVYFWDQEYEAEEGDPPTRNNLYFIADSFDKFVDTLSE